MIKATVIEVDDRDGYSVIRFIVSSIVDGVYIDGMFSAMVLPEHGYELGSNFDLVKL